MSERNDTGAEAKNKRKDFFRPGVTQEEVKAVYDDWSENYEEAVDSAHYHGPAIITEEVLRHVPAEKRPEARILDVAAGTGLVGRKLYREGFRLMDAVEPSEGMMQKLRESGIYTNDYLEFIGKGHSTVPRDTYDLVVIAGGLGEGHVPVSGLDDLVRVTKKGGLVIIAMRLVFLDSVAAYKDKLEPYMDELEKQGAWKRVERRVVSNFIFEEDGIVFVYCVN